MANINFSTPTEHDNRIIAAFTAITGQENPTNTEILTAVKAYCFNALKKRVLDYEKNKHNATFAPVDITEE